MPYITTTTNVALTEGKEDALKTRLGKAISLIPGKSESWLMVSFNPGTRMYFRGDSDEGIAFVNVSLFGGASDRAYDALTAEITGILSDELGISPDKIYIKYEECSHWGWNGGNF